MDEPAVMAVPEAVLIESDWNLKADGSDNRGQHSSGINRIRLEFKVSYEYRIYIFLAVLIESDWNLKG